MGDETPPVRQMSLFKENSSADTLVDSDPPRWARLTDPIERLAAVAADSSQHPAKRSEADSVLRLYRKHLADIEARLALGKPEVLPLGLLMLVPEDRHAT